MRTVPSTVWLRNPLEYTLSYDHTDVVASAAGKNVARLRKLLSKSPDGDFAEALEYVQRQYYAGSKRLPWVVHKGWVKGKNKNTEIKNAANKSWPLAWYWKALLPVLRQWNEGCKGKWIIQISQIRQWVMVLIYELNDRKPRLLRPPLFGPSQRILQDDQYWLLLAFEEHIQKAWRKAKDETDYERLHVLSRHDVVYKLLEFTPTGSTSQKLTVKLKCGLILNPHVTTMPDESLLDIKKMLIPPGRKQPKAEDARKLEKGISSPYPLLTIPTRQNDPNDAKPVSLLLSSDRVCEAVASLSEVWNDPTAKSVLIHAPPGSGKEILAKSIYDFGAFTGSYVPFALSPDSTLAESNQRMLYFRDMSKKKIAGEVFRMIQGKPDKQSKMQQSISDGLVFKARKGVLFLDEIDKEPDGRTRAGLLRLLENNEFAVFDTTLTVKIPKSQLPTYVLAASIKTLQDVLKLHPPDFWTRLSHFIEMQHPLTGASVEEQKQICADYFHMFWNMHVPKFFERGGLLPSPLFEKQSNGDVAKPNLFLHIYTTGLFWALMDLRVVRLLSARFGDIVLKRRRTHQISVRNIRSVVGRIVFSLVDLLLYDKDFEKPLANIRRTLASLSTDYPAVTIKRQWSDILAHIIAAEDFKPNDTELFTVKKGETDESKIVSDIAKTEICDEINLQITKLQFEIDGTIDAAISTLPSLE